MSQVTLLQRAVYIVAAKRTPIGAFGGTLKDYSATDMGVESAAAAYPPHSDMSWRLLSAAHRADRAFAIAALEAGGVDPSAVNSVVYGNVAQTASDAIYMARHIGLRVGAPVGVPALVVNRLCGSGFQALATGAMEIQMCAGTDVVLAGGSESMSQAPFATRGIRWGTRLGQSPVLEDTLWAGLTDSFCNLPMGITAENLAEQHEITRTEADEFGLRSQARWAAGHAAGAFDAEVAPVVIKSRRGDKVFDTDEHPKPNSTPESMSKLPTSFKKDGTVTAANASGICDGAASLVLASEDAISHHGLSPLARIVGFSSVGVEPNVMGIGPVPAIQTLLDASGLSLDDIGMVEVNEAFAPQALAVQKALGINDDVFNIHGGAIALGHPLGASGARIMAHLAHSTEHYSKYSVGSACIGGGMGMAMLLEKA